MWVARDKKGVLFLFKNKPERMDETWSWDEYSYVLDASMFPEVIWDSEPVEVSLTKVESGSKIEKLKEVAYEPMDTTIWDVDLVFPPMDIETEYKTVHKGGFGRFDWVEEFCDTPEECEFRNVYGECVFDEKKQKYVKRLCHYECPKCGSSNVAHGPDGDYEYFKCRDCGCERKDRVIFRD